MSSSLFRPSSSSSVRTISTALRSSLQVQMRSKHTHSTPQSLWLSRTHLNPAPAIPPPMVPTFPMRVILSDGSTFTAYTTAPTPSTKKLTRDVLNNPLWSPASERRGLGEGDEGRVGRFRKRFQSASVFEHAASLSQQMQTDAGADAATSKAQEDDTKRREEAFAADDLDWMSGGEEEKISERQRNPVKAGKGKGGKKK
ncbi:hypothetical protein I317_00562 [Kwoniella heveanensis CBS 569]|uniref:Uncharacterized protein n=1 Tax=Kwoniella heveanensis BCC8398 TaxID=1296120 RepID=A0A1B9GYF7_9TREE|nr:hypothetical protein I316_02536 [Kwoniella heveanensis BCC8398]OCF45659.1 hypothetical protein I317_00562 [Kwoniella heveanensis CBS 569]